MSLPLFIVLGAALLMSFLLGDDFSFSGTSMNFSTSKFSSVDYDHAFIHL